MFRKKQDNEGWQLHPETGQRTNAPAGDVGPFDSEGWKLDSDGSRIHRYRCTIHDGEDCDGHCGPQ